MASEMSTKQSSKMPSKMSSKVSYNEANENGNNEEHGGKKEKRKKKEGGNGNNSGQRLSVKQKTKIDKIRDEVEKPKGGVPPNGPSGWESLPLDQKLPMLPAPPGTLVFSRGALGESLLRERKGGFITDDPHHRQKVPSDKYEPLHDPFAMPQNSSEAQEALKEANAIDDGGNVLCTLKEFNRFRLYLASIHNEEVHMKLEEMDKEEAAERGVTHGAENEERLEEQRSKREERMKQAQENRANQNKSKRQNVELRQQQRDERLAQLEEERKQQQLKKHMQSEQEQSMAQERLKEKREQELKWKQDLLTDSVQREEEHAARKEERLQERREGREQKQKDQYESKQSGASERSQKERDIQEQENAQRKERANNRQKRVEKFRKDQPKRAKAREAKAKRLDAIVRKYAMRWLNRVRARLSQKSDAAHQSLWHSGNKNCLKECLKFLYQQSGYEKLDDVVMNILKFKEALKRQMLMEEEEEMEEAGEEDGDEDLD